MANKAFLNFYPKEMRSSVIGTTTIENYKPDEVKEFLKYDQLAFDEGYSSVNERINFPNGEELILYTQKVRFKDSNGEEFILGICQNITERQNLLEELTESNINLLRVNGELAEFSYRASHDLKSPLLTTLGLVDIIKEDIADKDFDEVDKNLNRIKEHTSLLEGLINDILNLTQADHSTVEESNINLYSLINEIQHKLEGLFKSKEVALQVDIPIDLEIKLCKVRLTQLIENLISNAIKYSEEERESFIKVKAGIKKGTTVIEVSDNGKGIPEKFQDQVFAMFKRFHPREATGSGLGLYLVKKHVDTLNGEISFKSTPEGTCFKLTF